MTLHVENDKGETFVGTAFLALDKNIAVTAWHVVSDATKVSAKFSNNRVVNVDSLIDKDEKHDLALIRLDGAGCPEAKLSLDTPFTLVRVPTLSERPRVLTSASPMD